MDSNPIHHPSPAKTIKCLFSDYIQCLMIGQTGWWTRTPSTTPLQPKKENACFWITFNFWWSAGLVDGLEPHLPPLSSQNKKMLVFGLCSTSDDRPGWSMDSNPICHPSPAKTIKCSFLDYIQLLMIGQVIWLTNSDWNAKKGPLSHHKMKCLFLDYVQLLIIGWVIWAMKVNWNVTKGPLSHRKFKCSFLDYIQLLMIGLVIWVDQNVKKWNVVSVRVFCCFSEGLLLFQSGSSVV